MFNKVGFLVFFCLLLFVVFHFPSLALAQQTDAVVVKSYGPGRTSHPLVNSLGNLPTPPLFSPNVFYNQLKNPNNFGSSGKVSCTIDLQGSTTLVLKGSLVDFDGNLLADIFFAPPISTPLTDTETEELAKFISLGGIIYLSGSSFPRVQGENLGPEFNPLFEKLNIPDRFKLEYEPIEGLIQSGSPMESIVTKGVFGDVGPLAHGLYRKFAGQNLKSTVPTVNSGSIAYEGRVGKGYMVATSDALYGNVVVKDSDNMKYYLNLFALGCDKSWQDNSVVLEVPSLKQGLAPYDGTNPYWEDVTYDDGNKLDLWCDVDGNGAKMYECACALTSANMVMNYFGVTKAPLGNSLDPAYLNIYAEEILPNGGYSGFVGGNFRWDFVGNFSKTINNVFSDQPKIGQPVRENFNVERVKELIDAGKPVILRVNSGSHWVVVKGYNPDTDRFIINDPVRPDPALGEYMYLDDFYTPDLMGSMIIYERTNSDYRYLQFATTSKNHLLIQDSLGNKTGYSQSSGQILTDIPNSDYVLDPYYASPVLTGSTPASNGIYFLTIKLPEDGEFGLEIMSQDGEAHPVQIYSSDTKGALAGKILEPGETGNNYSVGYLEKTAGQEVEVSVKAQVEITPFIPGNTIVPHKRIPAGVAVLASDTFDVTKVDRTSLAFGKTGNEQSLLFCGRRLVDVNQDGRRDLICYFAGDKLGLDTQDTKATLKGMYDGTPFFGVDSVQVFKPGFLF